MLTPRSALHYTLRIPEYYYMVMDDLRIQHHLSINELICRSVWATYVDYINCLKELPIPVPLSALDTPREEAPSTDPASDDTP
jgi:hypothetical protein